MTESEFLAMADATAAVLVATRDSTTASASSSGGGIHKIKHVIVIMQENRSFDSYFGTYPGAAGLPSQNGTATSCVPVATSASTVCDPIKPAPPVTRIRIVTFSPTSSCSRQISLRSTRSHPELAKDLARHPFAA